MSKKDYVAIAACVRAIRFDGDLGPDGEALVDRIAYDLCRVFAEDNDLFDEERFLSAAGVRT